MKCHHPDVFCAALLNAQPMGFYAPAQIVRDAREHGVEVRPVCVNASRWDCTLEPAEGRFLAVRLGLRMVKGLANEDGARIVVQRGGGALRQRRGSVAPGGGSGGRARTAGRGGCLPALGLDRRQALWAIRGLARHGAAAVRRRRSRGAAPAGSRRAAGQAGADAPEGREVVEDYSSVGLTLRRHPVAFLRGNSRAGAWSPAPSWRASSDGSRVVVAGIVLVRQRPGSARGVLFITIEDETGRSQIWSSGRRFSKASGGSC